MYIVNLTQNENKGGKLIGDIQHFGVRNITKCYSIWYSSGRKSSPWKMVIQLDCGLLIIIVNL